MQTKSDRAGDEQPLAGEQKARPGGSDPQSSTPPASAHQTDPLTASEAAGPLAAHGESTFEQRFRGLNELARGGQGRVLVGRDVVLEREVAVKELLRANHPAAVRRFEREARLTARLQHPGIVSIYELARKATGEPALVMRRVQGVPLDQALAQAGSYAKRLAYLPAVTAACDAIAYAHRQGVLHRDIKASNVLVGEFGETVVIDWGIAKELASSDPESTDPASPDQNPDLTAPG
ncbi:MAG: protein kinase, partial [Deltaproteobacteria bacterium]|nr:protein kinase [Deltaproteobacteria bacterium]